MKLPDDLASLFHNYDFTALDGYKNYRLVIRTVLSLGTWEQVKWLFDFYGAALVGEVFKEDYYGLRTLPAPARKLWEIAFIKSPLKEPESGPAKYHSKRIIL
ncbi:MAG: DUF6922 domain-containing protein [Eubacteriales bacterium]